MNEVMIIDGIECYEKEGIAYLKLETVARGLGFSRIAASGNEVVRWETVRKYLSDLGVPTSWHEKESPTGSDGLPDFIPENIFYRLAMKAKNEAAEVFQAKIADEVLPAIRKHGAYLTPAKIEEILFNPDAIIQLATNLKEEQQKRLAAEQQIKADKPKVLFADAVSASSTSILIGELAKILKQNGVETGQKRLFEWLRENGYLMKQGTSRNMPTQKSMEAELFEIKETTITNPDGSIRVTKTPKVTGKGQQYFINLFLTPNQQEGA